MANAGQNVQHYTAYKGVPCNDYNFFCKFNLHRTINFSCILSFFKLINKPLYHSRTALDSYSTLLKG